MQAQVQAVIAWGWEDRAFYTRWLGIKEAETPRPSVSEIERERPGGRLRPAGRPGREKILAPLGRHARFPR